MLIIISMNNFARKYKDLMHDLADRLSIVQPKVDIPNAFIEIELDEFKSIRIVFKPTLEQYLMGIRPDYYWTNSYDVDKYFRYCPNVKCLQNFTELTDLVLRECQKAEEKGDFL